MDYYNTLITEKEKIEISRQQKLEKRIKTAKYLISFTLAFVGFFILGTQLGPLGMSYLKGILLQKQIESIKDPAPAQELNPSDSDLPYYDPGLSYFQNLVQHISPGSTLGASSDQTNPNIKPAKIDETYSQEMRLSIPSIGISDIILTPNVDSFKKDIYNAALKKGLAHFKSTPLPGDGGNSFIYGHSAVDSWFSGHEDYPETIFTKLEQVEVADKVYIQKDGKTLEYTVQKKKITDPDNFDVIIGTNYKETVTLMTCWPLGLGTQRLIVIAERTDNGQ